MLTKLALKNAGKNIREYAIYFFTLAFGVCVFYLFNSIYAQQAMMNVSEQQADSIRSVMQMLSYISVFVAVVLGFLIVYANNFFIKRRKKELGLYMTLGMRKGRISMILVLETSLIAALALAVGLLAGVVLSQFMSIFTARIFEADLSEFRFVFAPDAAAKSVLYFGIIFLIVIVFNTLAVSRFKLIDLLYGGQKNESHRVRSVGVNAVLCVLSMAILGTAYYLIVTNGMLNVTTWKFGASIGCGIVGTLLFFYSLSGLLTVLLRSNQRIYYKGLNLFVVRQLSSKVNTNFISVSVVSIVLLLTIGIFSVGYSMQDMMSGILRDKIQYDYSFVASRALGDDTQTDYDSVYRLLRGNENVKGSAEVHLYDMDVTYRDIHMQIPESLNADAAGDMPVTCIALSEYNAALALRGAEGITLADGEYAVLSTYSEWDAAAQELVDSRRVFTVGGTALVPKEMTAQLFDNSMRAPIIVVPDQYVKGLPCAWAELLVMCRGDQAAQAFETQLDAQKYEDMPQEKRGFSYYDSRLGIYAQSVTTRALLAFLAIYLGLVFMMTCAAILAIQQLTDVSDNKYRYDLLGKLGADKKMLRRALFVQVLCYFLLPLLLAVVHSFFGLWAANDALVSMDTHIGASLAQTAAFVGALYAAYFGMTYVGAKSCLRL